MLGNLSLFPCEHVTCTAIVLFGTLIAILKPVTLCTHTKVGLVLNPVTSADISLLTSGAHYVMCLLALQ